MRCVYVGELSGCFIAELKVGVLRGEPFEAPETWIKERVKQDPERWKIATDAEAVPVDPEPEINVKVPEERDPNPFPQPRRKPSQE